MKDHPFPESIARLLVLGEPQYSRDFQWPDYLAFGIQGEHIDALISLATNQSLIMIADEKDPRGWAPIHAWRALGQLHSIEAIQPLMRLFHEIPDNDWVIEEMPDVFALIGPEAFSPLEEYLRTITYPVYSRLVAATSLMQIAVVHPQMRDKAVDTLAGQLADYTHNTPGMNGVLIANLVELEAVEKIDLIHQVYKDGPVDRFIVGDWRDVKLRLQPGAGYGVRIRPKSLGKSNDVSPDPEENLKPGGSAGSGNLDEKQV